MIANRVGERSVTLIAMLAVAAVTSQCSGSPTAASSSMPVVAAISFDSTSVSAGGATHGTVSLSAPAPADGASLVLSSSNSAVATAQTSAAVPPGSSSVAIMVTAVSPGTTTITASFNGVSRQSPPLTVTGGAPSVALASISLSEPSTVGGFTVTGTVTLTGAAPAGGAAVALSSADPVTVPASVTVPSGLVSATFTASTRAVGGTMSATIKASYGGASASVALSVTMPTVAIARFGVTGPTETETCALANGGTTLNCTFNGSTSTAPGTIVQWDWAYGVTTMFTQTTSGPVLSMPAVDCSMMPAPPLPPGNPWFTMIVTLVVHDNFGNVSPKSMNAGVRLVPQGACGF